MDQDGQEARYKHEEYYESTESISARDGCQGVARIRGIAVEGDELGIYHGSEVNKTWSCMTCTIPEVQRSSFILYYLHPLLFKLAALLLRWSTGFLSHTHIIVLANGCPATHLFSPEHAFFFFFFL